MKKVLSLVLSVIMILSCLVCMTSFASDDIKVTINGQNLTMDQPPVLISDRTLVPVRAIFEALGAKVDWNNDTNTATGVLGDTTVEIQIENTTAKVNGKDVTLDVPAKLISDRTLVPVRFISESLGAKVDWDDATQTVIISTQVSSDENTIVFDNLSAYKNNVDYTLGGSLKESGISLSNEKDHTSGSGKSLKIEGRTNYYNRIKILNAFPKEYVGKTVVVSAYIYYPDMDADVRIGSYSETGTDYSGNPAEFTKVDVPKNTWTKVEWEFIHEKEIATMLGIDQSNDKSGVVPVMYIDDITIKLKTNETSNIVISDMTNHRPVPTQFTKSSKMDDLIYYEDKKDIGAIVDALPAGEIMMTSDEFLAGKLKGTSYGKEEIVDVSDMDFSKAVRITVNQKTKNIYDIQHEVDIAKAFEAYDVCVLTAYARLVSGGDNDTNTGAVQFILEENGGSYSKSLQTDTVLSQQWTKLYMPFKVNDKLGDKSHFTIRVGQYAQVVEIANAQIMNYKKTISINDLPTAATYKGQEPDAEWRKEALDRIEKIRKGDFKLVIKDASGNIIPNADINVSMTEHEFQWGTAINGNLLAENDSGQKYRDNLIKYFNGAVLENNHKWFVYEENPSVARQMVDTLKGMGIKYIRGHCLMWDKAYYEGNSSVPVRLGEAIAQKDLEKAQGYAKEHIFRITKDFQNELCDWDVSNELFRSDTDMRYVFGNDIVVDWYKWANEANSGAKLYMNEHRMVGTDNYLDSLIPLIEELQSKGAKWDGIGVQAHFATPCYPPQFYAQLETLSKYADELKITEFDFTADDQELHASFVRDILITIFSHEKIQGFFCWGFKDDGTAKYLLFDKDWNRKKAADQFEDLVYNKWWTKESGKTNANGEYDIRAFYGDYDITVTANGQTKTVNIPMYKANEGTVEVVMQ